MASSKPKAPTQKQCDSWRFSLENALQDPVGFEHFFAFLENYETERRRPQGEYTRYLDFWKECNEYKKSTGNVKDLKQNALGIFKLYLAPRAKKKIELGGDDDIISTLKDTIDKVEDDEDDDENGNSVLLSVFNKALDSMREYLDEGGCSKAYDKWKKQLKPEVKKKQGFSCRLM